VNFRPSAVRTLPDRSSTAVDRPGSRHATTDEPASADSAHPSHAAHAADALTVLIVVPSLHAGAADAGAVGLVRILGDAGHRAIVVSRGGRLEQEVVAGGGEFVRLDVASKNPAVMLLNAATLIRLIRRERPHLVHAHGRSAGWSGYLAARATGVPFLTTWYKGFREQNVLKRMYNGVMAKGEKVIAVSDQIAELIGERYGVPPDRIAVVPAAVDIARFDPGAVTGDRVEAVRRAWGVKRDTKVMLVVGRMLRRKGHHVVIKAVRRLKELGLRDFACVFVGEDQGLTRYSGEVWDLVLATDTADVVRLAGAVEDLPAAYAAASVVVSGAIQLEGLQRAILEAQAMARPVVVSDLGCSPEAVLAPPVVSEDRMTGYRIQAGDDAALAAALVRLFAVPDGERQAIGGRGRAWVATQFDPAVVAEQTLAVYASVARNPAGG
jgi:glycosyltransferase involved in cell wall biosynthesis